MRRDRQHNTDAGFSVLELLVALALVALMAVSLLGVLGFSRRALEVAEAAEDGQSFAYAQDFLRRSLSAIQPAGEPGSDGKVRLAFRGSADELVFVTNMSGKTTLGGLHEISLTQPQQGSERAALVVSLRLFRPGIADRERPDAIDERVLIDGIARTRFRYYGHRVPDEAPQWHDDWTDATLLPRLIAVSVGLGEDDPRQWPELIIDTRLR